MNMKLFGVLTLSAVGLWTVGCDDSHSSSTPPAQRTPAADNTGRNKGDLDAKSKTPMDQSQSQSDITIAAEIRKSILSESGMSTNAQNCKITSDHGVVTLRGVVNSQAEKDSIEAKAKAVTGVTRVDNQLEVKAS